jgi:hypothetical protein
MIESEKEEGRVQIPLVWGKADTLPTVYANQLYISHAGGEFYLVFGEVAVPMLLTLGREPVPDHLEIRPVAKLVIRPEVMLQFAEAINTNIGRYLSRQKDGESDE